MWNKAVYPPIIFEEIEMAIINWGLCKFVRSRGTLVIYYRVAEWLGALGLWYVGPWLKPFTLLLTGFFLGCLKLYGCALYIVTGLLKIVGIFKIFYLLTMFVSNWFVLALKGPSGGVANWVCIHTFFFHTSYELFTKFKRLCALICKKM